MNEMSDMSDMSDMSYMSDMSDALKAGFSIIETADFKYAERKLFSVFSPNGLLIGFAYSETDALKIVNERLERMYA